jgi:hypothetical protein
MNTSDGKIASPPSPSVEARLKALGADFARELPARLGELRAAWAVFAADPTKPRTPERLTRIHDIVHQFAGSGRHFGRVQLGAAAAPLDEFLANRRKRKRPLAPDEVARIDGMIREIERAATLSPPRDDPGGEPET